jgi:hypothetical protein
MVAAQRARVGIGAKSGCSRRRVMRVSVPWARLAVSMTEGANAAGICGTGSDTCRPTLGWVYPFLESVSAPQRVGSMDAMAHVAHAFHRCTYTRTKRLRVTHRCMLVDLELSGTADNRPHTAGAAGNDANLTRVAGVVRSVRMLQYGAKCRHTGTTMRIRAGVLRRALAAIALAWAWPCRTRLAVFAGRRMPPAGTAC